MKSLIAVMFIAVNALTGCGWPHREVAVADVTKSETVVLKKRPGQGSITGIFINGRGSIVGKAEVQLILNGAVYRQEEVSGDIRFTWGGDWYADQAEVRYIAGTAAAGSLTLRYGFSGL